MGERTGLGGRLHSGRMRVEDSCIPSFELNATVDVWPIINFTANAPSPIWTSRADLLLDRRLNTVEDEDRGIEDLDSFDEVHRNVESIEPLLGLVGPRTKRSVD